jgi:acyl carrier protein phosphodiesterase
MNWLAHVYLSKPDVEFRLGNLLADIVRRHDRTNMPPAFLDGIRQHQLIDKFADTHPTFYRSRARIGPEFRRASGILIDIFYDHFLALDWNHFAPEPLDAFSARLYADIRQHPIPLPEHARMAVEGMIAGDWLGSYRRVEGVESALQRVSMRLVMRTGRDLGLERSVSELVDHFDQLRADFAEFFPQLQSRISAT